MKKSDIVGDAAAAAEADYKFDWCEKLGVLANVKKQEGDVCWAFCTISTIEAINEIATGKAITMSEQYLIDCDHYNKGYTVGNPLKAFKFIVEKRGVVYKASEYKFIAAKGDCKCEKYKPVATIDGYGKVEPEHDEEALKKAVRRQPVTSSIDARYIKNYKRGILNFDPTFDLNTVFQPKKPEEIPLHGFVIVGFGRENGIDYWKCRNSNGPIWGENGYFRLRRNVPNYPDAFNIARKCWYPWKKGVNKPGK